MEIDPRGPRFGAAITVVVLAVVLITGSIWLLAAQLVVFAVGALAGLRYAPYGVLYRRLIRPRLGPPAHTEAEAPPRRDRSARQGLLPPQGCEHHRNRCLEACHVHPCYYATVLISSRIFPQPDKVIAAGRVG